VVIFDELGAVGAALSQDGSGEELDAGTVPVRELVGEFRDSPAGGGVAGGDFSGNNGGIGD
jgi:hypothetical protein